MWEAAIPAVVSTVGSLLGGKKQQDTSQEMAREQMAFQERMSNTAHQREVADLRAAGLNPILSANRGASSPTGAMGTAVDFIGNASRAGVNSALASRRLEADLEAIETGIAKTEAETATAKEMPAQVRATTANTQMNSDLQAAQWMNQGLMADQIKAQTYKTNQETINVDKLGKILDEQLHSARAAATDSNIREDFLKTPFGEVLRKMGIGMRELNPLLGGANSAKSIIQK